VVVEREQRRDERRQRAEVVHEPEPVPHRRVALAGAGDFPSAGRLEELVVPGPIGARAEWPVRAGVAIDDLGVDGLHRFVIDTEPARRGHAEVVVHDVGPADERFECGARLG
jgi:hypothetical protein